MLSLKEYRAGIKALSATQMHVTLSPDFLISSVVIWILQVVRKIKCSDICTPLTHSSPSRDASPQPWFPG